MFNSIKLGFRNLKKLLYTKVHEDMDEVIKDAIKILENNDYKKSIKYNFKDNLEKYIIFVKKYKNINLKEIKSNLE